jgi:6-phosphogluconolactonase/glucosamine-6-phosphate isomerase/deaminase
MKHVNQHKLLICIAAMFTLLWVAEGSVQKCRGNVPQTAGPAVSSVYALTGEFRTVFANMLWIKVDKYLHERIEHGGDAFENKEAMPMIRMITELDPHFIEAYRTGAMLLYIGLNKDAPQGFGNFLRDRIFGQVNFKSVNYLQGNAADPEQECRRYSELLRSRKIDAVCMGIGENGHIAFNDPHVAEFDDPSLVKVVELDQKCRMQQVNDGCFETIDQVPTHALTLTIPALMSGGRLFCVVPAKTKAQAVKGTVQGKIEEACPASILRTHAHAALYLDQDSSSLL